MTDFQITLQNIKGKGKTGYKSFLEFKITQRDHSKDILYKIKDYFNCGRINIDNRKTKTMKYVVTNIDDLLNIIIPHFDEYPLLTSKYLNYVDFKNATLLMKDKGHYNLEGINNLKDIKSKMNKSRSFSDKFFYCWNKDIIIHPEWVQGFIDGEGSFQCEIGFTEKIKLYPYVNFSLQIKQNNHDVAILQAIKNFFWCGYLKPKYDIKDIKAASNAVRSTTSLWFRNIQIICDFFDLYPLYTIKKFDYEDWKRLINLKQLNAHLDERGLILMKKIKSNMNNNRFK